MNSDVYLCDWFLHCRQSIFSTRYELRPIKQLKV